MALGLLVGIIIGWASVKVAGIPLTLGSGGGALLSGLLFGWAAAICACAAATARAQSAPDPPKPIALQVGHVTFTPGGYVKADAIFDFDPIDSRDSFNPLTIPVDGSEGLNVRLHARQSRLSLDLKGDEASGGMHRRSSGSCTGCPSGRRGPCRSRIQATRWTSRRA